MLKMISTSKRTGSEMATSKCCHLTKMMTMMMMMVTMVMMMMVPCRHIAWQEGWHMGERGCWPLLLLTIAIANQLLLLTIGIGCNWGGANPVGRVVVHLIRC